MNIKLLLKDNFLDNYPSLLRFLAVGLFSAIFNLSIFAILLRVGINYHLAVTCSYVLTLVIYFFANRQFTFKNNDPAIKTQLLKFIFIVIINYLLTLFIVHSCVEFLGLHPIIGTMTAIGFTTFSNYFIARNWIFASSIANY